MNPPQLNPTPPSYQLYQSHTSKDEQLYDATVLPSGNANDNLSIPAMSVLNVSSKQVTFSNTSKYSIQTQSTSQGTNAPTQISISSHNRQSQNLKNSNSTYLGDNNTTTELIRPTSITSTATSNTSRSAAFSSQASVSSQNSIPSVHTPMSPDSPHSSTLHSALNRQQHQHQHQHQAHRHNMGPYHQYQQRSYHNNCNNNNNNNSGSGGNNHRASTPWSRPRLKNRQSSTSFKKQNSQNDGGPFQIKSSNNGVMDMTYNNNMESSDNSPAELKVNESMNVRIRSGSNPIGGIKIRSSMIPPCPNLVNKKCRCKEILQQNPSAQKIWGGCYRIKITNKDQHYDNREIDIAYFDGLYGGLCKYFQYEVDTDRVPTKKDISLILKNHKGFTVDENNSMGATKNTMVIDRCHFVEFWKWFRGCCDIIKDIYRVWDTQYPFQMDLFVNRKKCEQVLQDTPDGM